MKAKTTIKCVSCGSTKTVQDTRDVTYTYKGRTTIIPNVSGEYCLACDESLHNMEESEYLNNSMRDFVKEVNASIVDPEFISDTRKKLRLDQREAGEIFGGGANAFSRYENGKTKPPLSLVLLFRLLDSHPALIDEIRPKPEPVDMSQLRRRKGVLKLAVQNAAEQSVVADGPKVIADLRKHHEK